MGERPPASKEEVGGLTRSCSRHRLAPAQPAWWLHVVPRPNWGGEPHSGRDSPGIARLPTCAPRRWEREYSPPDPLAAIPRPGLPLQGRVCFAHRREEGNRAILEFSGCHWRPGGGEGGEGEKRLKRGLRLRTNSHPPLPSLASVGGKLSPRTLNPNHLGSPPLRRHSTPRTPRPPPPHKCRINSDIQGLKGRTEWLSRISPFYVDGTELEASFPTPSTHPAHQRREGVGRERGWEEEDHDKDEIWQRVPRLWLLTVRVVRLLLPLMVHVFHHHHHHHPRTFIERLLCAGHGAGRWGGGGTGKGVTNRLEPRSLPLLSLQQGVGRDGDR